MIFIAQRGDGFGGRIRAILNAMYLSRVFEVDFKFAWAERKGKKAVGHAIRPVNQMFSRDFVDLYHMPDSGYEGMTMVNFNQYILNSQSFRSDDKVLINVDQIPLGQMSKLVNELGFNKPEYSSLYSEIKFSEDLEEARKHGKDSIEKGKYAAIHARAGDIVYGGFRFSDEYSSKVMPISLFSPIINKLKEGNFVPLLFGEDQVLQKLISQKTSAELSQDYHIQDGYNTEEERAIFEVQMMSRCARIYGGSSGFINLASWIGNVPRPSFRDIFDIETILESVESFLADSTINRVSWQQEAFLCRSACLIGGEGIPITDRFIRLHKRASDLDAGNTYYILIKAASFYARGNLDLGELTLLEAFEGLIGKGLFNGSFHSLWTNSSKGAMIDMNSWFEYAAKAEQPFAALCTAIRYYSLGSLDRAREFYSIHKDRISEHHRDMCHSVTKRLATGLAQI